MDRDQYCFILNKINVNTITNNSAIFVGFNNALGWRTQLKQNYGFGTGGNSNIIGNTFVVIDNDVVDAPVDNRIQDPSRSMIELDAPSSPEEQEIPITLIKFDKITVNTLNRNSTIAIGENMQTHWETFNKQNYGIGFFSGENVVGKNLNIIQDEDFIDAPITEQSVNNSLLYSRNDEGNEAREKNESSEETNETKET